jgi:hypothetical protein
MSATGAPTGPPRPATEVAVEVTVDSTGAPGDLYTGTLSSVDGAVSVPLRVAIDELGIRCPELVAEAV